MLSTITLDEAAKIIHASFSFSQEEESVTLSDAFRRVLSRDIVSGTYVPNYHRSTVDGYAVRAEDTFGCSDALPAVLTLSGKVRMGHALTETLMSGNCVAIPTGGAVPLGADAVVMLEYTEDYSDGTIGVMKPAAPGQSMIFRGDDMKPGQLLLPRGRRLLAQDIGMLAAMGITEIPVRKKLRVGILSTGDELISAAQNPIDTQIRDVNSSMLAAAVTDWDTNVVCYGIIPDQEQLLNMAIRRAVEECDVTLVSGGSSVGEMDAVKRVLETLGDVLFHGIAVKPGKPTMLARAGKKPVLGLPGHPVAAFYMTRLLVRPLLARLSGSMWSEHTVQAVLTESVSANHGRAQITGVSLTNEGDNYLARPLYGKSGLIGTMSGCDGYIIISRDCEGLTAGTKVDVRLLD